MRIRGLAFTLCIVALPVMAASLPSVPDIGATAPRVSPDRLLDLLNPDSQALDAACCKMCKKGLACGDTCISRNKACIVGPGCACQAPGY